MPIEIEAKIKSANEQLNRFGYGHIDVSVKEFYDWMTGEIFSPDTTTTNEVLATSIA